MKQLRLLYCFFIVLFLHSVTNAQIGDIESQLYGEVENWNPVYKPVIGLGIGAFNFLGDVKNPNQAAFNGSIGYKVNVATFVDNNHYLRANFYFMGGSLLGNNRTIDPTLLHTNFNFKSDILMFGINLNYDFDNFYKSYRKVHPFVSLGIETITFNTKSDLSANINGEEVAYNYWADGSIRTEPQTAENPNAPIMMRDYTYETGVRGVLEWGMKEYPQYSFGVPIDLGLDFWLADRVLFRIGASYHIVFSDLIDHVSSENKPNPLLSNDQVYVGDKGNDNFMYTYFTLHLDLFSSDKTLTWEKLYADVEWDGTLMDDEDGDGWFDGYDNCPGTPWGVETDTSGCPIDKDKDGVPDYIDDEPNSRYRAYVDERGVEMSVNEIISRLDMSEAVARKDVDMYLRSPESYEGYKDFSTKDIPEKYIKVDYNADGYISYDEMMDAIDEFFDFDSEMSSDDVYKLNEFFFSQ